MDTDYLFVYGSLLKQANNIMSAYLSGRSELLGEGLMEGKLFMIDYYPGAIYSSDSIQKVRGDVYKLNEKDSTFQVLDNYEDFIPGDPENSAFIRKIVPIQYEDQVLHCWVYLYNQDYSTYQIIPSGDYLRFDVNQH
ncbi:MAG: gamma-glutamylcyclotransferase [Bacteroidia bacterium]|nr:gamma-glutamylcyclotransferase [Bacteroidia bacterium]